MPTLLERISVSLNDRYHIERELGQGGMATVFLATDVRHGRKVAIKVLHPELSAVIGAERFENEVKLTASLQHPHILALFDSGVADGLVYYVMPFVEGETLRGRLERERQLSVNDAVRLAREIADALQYAHERGIVHRDIKPENVLLQNGHAIVADFGIALAVQQAGGSRMTQTGMSLGTPQYMAPEQAMGEKNVDARADVYALGAVTYEMLAGEPPFTGPTAQAIVAKVMTERSRGLRSVRDTVPAAVESAVATALEKLPADRQNSAKSFAEDLRRTDSGLHPIPASDRASSLSKSNVSRKIAAFTASGIAAGIAIGAFAFKQQSTSATVNAQPLRFEVTPPDSVSLRLVCCGQMFTMSSDGRLLVFQGTPKALGDAKSPISDYQLYLHDLTDLSVRALPGTSKARELFFSPDNSEIAFSVGNELKRLKLSGGQAQTIATLPSGFNGGGSWYGDTILFAVTNKMLRVLANGGTPQVLFSTNSAELQVFTPFVVEKPRVLLYTKAQFGQNPRVFWRSLDDGREHFVVEGATPRYIASRGMLTLVRGDGTLAEYPFDITKGDTLGPSTQLAANVALRSPILTHAEYSTSETGSIVLAVRRANSSNGITITDISAAVPTNIRLLGALTGFTEPEFSGDSRSLSISARGTTGEVESAIIDVKAGSATNLQMPGVSGAIAFSRSADSLIYRTGARDILISPSDGRGAPRALMQVKDWILNDYAIETSGPWLAFSARRDNGSSFLHVAIAHRDSGGIVTYTTGTDKNNEARPAISPDGKWIAFISLEGGLYHAYVTTFPKASARYAVSPNDVRNVTWSSDNSTLYYAEEGKIFATRFNGGEGGAVPSFSAPRLLYQRDPWGTMAIAPDGKHFAFVDRVREGDARTLVVRLNAVGANNKR